MGLLLPFRAETNGDMVTGRLGEMLSQAGVEELAKRRARL